MCNIFLLYTVYIRVYNMNKLFFFLCARKREIQLYFRVKKIMYLSIIIKQNFIFVNFSEFLYDKLTNIIFCSTNY